MAISKAKKDELFAQYVTLLNDSRAVFLTDYTGIEVKKLQELRKTVTDAQGNFTVTKNTILRYALEETGTAAPMELLTGQTGAGFALGEAPGLAKALIDFAKEEERLIIKGGIMDGQMLTADQVEALAKMPSLDQLRGQLAGLISAPARNLASVVASGVRQVVNVIDAYSKSEEAAEAA